MLGVVVELGLECDLVATTGCIGTAEITEDPFVAYDCYKIGAIGFTISLAGAATAVQA